MGILYVVATPIGNLNDISKRALDILENSDLIAAEDTRNTIKILNHYKIKKKMTSYHKFNEKNKSNTIIEYLLKNQNVALVSDAGTPCISDPGYELVKLAREKNIEVISIPGPSAVITALSISGLDTTKFTFLGFLPTETKKIKDEIEKIKRSDIKTFVIYESPKRVVNTVEILKEEFESCNVFIASDLTKFHERGFFGNIEEVYQKIKKDQKIEKGEYVIVLEKKEQEENKDKNKEKESIESLLVDTMIKNKCSLKEAITILNKNNKNLKKNMIYEASLNLKKIIESK